MSTLILKVLSVQLKNCLLFSTIVWFTVSTLGSVLLSQARVTDLPLYQVIALSLVMSAPAHLIILPAFLFKKVIQEFSLFFSVVTSLLSCAVVVLFFKIATQNFPIDRTTKIGILTPYVISALIVIPMAFIITTRLKEK